MRKLITLILLCSMLQSCNNSRNQSLPPASDEQSFTSELRDGRYTMDFTTAQELKSMHYTIENFTLLNKKKFENLKAYQEFGDLMQMHAERVTTYCRLDPETKNLLCKKLDKIKAEVQTLHGDDMEKSKAALKNINSCLAEIDSTFNYMN